MGIFAGTSRARGADYPRGCGIHQGTSRDSPPALAKTKRPGRDTFRAVTQNVSRGESLSGRHLLEDALKHLHESEYSGTSATVASLAGAHSLSLEQAGHLLEEMARAGLATSGGADIRLTDHGRDEARHIVRAHRVYETYLARETGITSEDWHRHADEAEHRLTREAVDALADRLGRPRYDPHGDPIPTRDGSLPPRRGIPLLETEAGAGALVLHLEDEPAGVYRCAAEAGILAGSRLQVLAREPDQLRVAVEDRICELSLSVAGAIQVQPCAPPPPVRPLSSLRAGDSARIAHLSPLLGGGERRRILDLGLVPGTLILRDFDSMLGSPTAYRVRGATVALRKEQADRIFVET